MEETALKKLLKSQSLTHNQLLEIMERQGLTRRERSDPPPAEIREEAERKRKAETDEKEGTNEDEGLLVEDETVGETNLSLFSKAMKEKEGEGEPEVEVTFDTTAFVETPLTEGCRKIRDLELELNALEKKGELIKMQKATVLQELRKEKKRALLLLKNSLENE